MIDKLYFFETDSVDPYKNLATEKYLMDQVRPGECVLYLWQNKNTVVIGRNQNAFAECRTTLLQEEGGVLARRLSGGGAVFHDLGNLNFTFLMCKEDYDLDRQLQVIEKACKLAGIPVERSGRNDLLADGRKFSGNAFYQNRTHAYHHGTLMVDVDTEKLGRYLSPSKAKLESKGVASVRSRVVNLKALAPQLTIGDMKEYMKEAFCQVYGQEASPLALQDSGEIHSLQAEYSSWEYLYGTPMPFTFSCEDRFPWGAVQLQINAKGGVITELQLFSDSMDWSLSGIVQETLTGCRFCLADMQTALLASPLPKEIADDLCNLLQAQSM